MGKETSPRKASIALWIYGATLLTIALVNIWIQLYNPSLIKVMVSVTFIIIIPSCVVLSAVAYVLNGYKPIFRK